MNKEIKPAVESAANATQNDPANEVQLLREQLDSAQKERDAANAKLLDAGLTDDIAPLVALKMAMGLSREDATVCARRQIKHNKIIGGIEAEARAASAAAKAQLKTEDPLAGRAEVMEAGKAAFMGVYSAHRGELIAAAS